MIRKLLGYAVLLGVLTGIFLYYAPKAKRIPIRPAPTATDTASTDPAQNKTAAPQHASPAVDSSNPSNSPKN